MNILLLTAHSIAEYDDLRMLTDLGADVFSIGAYTDPGHPGDQMRPPLPTVPFHPDLARMCDVQRQAHDTRDADWAIDWAKADIHPGIVDWADVIICHHYLDRWIVPQWPKLRHKRVIWRTCGQSDPQLEAEMGRLRQDGLEIVRYSPKEATIPGYAGKDALIRFGKYPADWGPWTGDGEWVGNITQNMAGRGDHVGLGFWLAATEGLPARPAGPGSEQLPGGIGALSYDEMREYLRRCRAYLYTGTSPAPYTLGLIEAMLTGVPVVSIGPEAWCGPSELFEGLAIVYADRAFNDPASAREYLGWMLDDRSLAAEQGAGLRQRALDLFSIDTVGPQWAEYLGLSLSQPEIERRIGAVA